MAVGNSVDPVRIGEEFFYRLFHFLFHDEGARKHFELSQINFFNSREGLPGWNLWFQENTGAYQLALVEARTLHDEEHCTSPVSPGATPVTGRLAVKYFPAADDPLLDSYSCTETLLRLGTLFDHTGTPTLAGQGRIDDSCFVVGYLDFRTDTNRKFIELDGMAPNRWRDVRVDGFYIETAQNGKVEAVVPGGIDRDVPGWDLAFFFFDKLFSVCGYAFKTSPYAAVFARKKWTRFDIDKNHCCKETLDSDIELFHLVTGFEMNDDGNGNHRPLPSREVYVQMVNDRLTAEGFRLPEICTDPDESAYRVIRPWWWSAGELHFSPETDLEMHHCCYHDH
ncbi:hypothetical protein DSCW_45060 [Desulfosarcina widdelii]|uniref:Uncharacterized protein n=1 Tax=Desulfosarcina widdelii TaxID=947919 RepID=A0A5K7ZAA7_9BACT|nr:hypothetical protein [Desulfosarcina widdelii]BBO77089.1 hypothetical protein DSCW_45060 [Desulfosarcina widdelii]